MKRKRGGGANPTRTGVPVGLPSPWRAPLVAGLLLSLLYIREQGTPWRHNSYSLSRVRCPPPPFTPPVILSKCLGEALRGSLHHHHHHAVVLTKLSLDTLRDQEFEGRHRAERVQNSEVSYFSA